MGSERGLKDVCATSKALRGEGKADTMSLKWPSSVRDTEQVGPCGLSKGEIRASQVAPMVKNPPTNAGDVGSIPAS